VRFTLTEPRPIGSTGSGIALEGFAADGVALWSANGEACGVGLLQNGVLHFSAIDPSGVLGNSGEYPFLTIALTVPNGLTNGTSFPFTWTPGSWISSPSGPLLLSVKTGTVTIGGSLSISGIYPGGGTYPAGSLIRILGTGFQNNIHIQTHVKYSSISITPNEIDLYLKEQTTLDSQSVQLVNPDGSSATYFAYLKGVLVRQPSADLLKSAEFAFPLQTHALATVGPASALANGQWVALALQNPNPGPAVVTIALPSQNKSSSILLPSAGRIADTLSDLLNGATIQPGDTVQVTSTAMIQIMGINGDDQAQTLAPFIPSF
jgi:hypothetical protein